MITVLSTIPSMNTIKASFLWDITQAKCEKVMKTFRDAKIQLLVATDAAARGLDVEGVTHVFNYDIPQEAESYIHRIGRTERAGQTGVAVTFVSPKDRDELRTIERGIKSTIEKRMPKSKDNNRRKRVFGRKRSGRRSMV